MICKHPYGLARLLHISSYTKLSLPKLPLRFCELSNQDFPDCANENILRNWKLTDAFALTNAHAP